MCIRDRVHTDAHAARLTALFLGFARVNHSGPKCAAGSVQSPGHYGNPGRNSGLCRGGLCHRADDLMAVIQRRKQALADTKPATHLEIPFSFADIITVQAITLRTVLRDCSG